MLADGMDLSKVVQNRVLPVVLDDRQFELCLGQDESLIE